MRPVAKFICENVKEQTNEIGKQLKTLDSVFSFPDSLSIPCTLSSNEKYSKHTKTKRVETDIPVGEKEVGKKKNVSRTETNEDVVIIKQVDELLISLFILREGHPTTKSF